MSPIRLLIPLAIAVLLSGCHKARDFEILKAASLSDTAPLTTEAEPREIALGIYHHGASFAIADVFLDEKRPAILWLCCSETRAPIIARRSDKPVGADDFAPYFVERSADGLVNPHRNFIIGMLAAGGIDKRQEFMLPTGDAFTLEQFVKQALFELPPIDYFNSKTLQPGPEGNELGWTLLAMAHLADIHDPWITLHGEKLTAGDVLRAAISHEIPRGSCAGAHELIGIAALLAAYEADRAELKGEWKNARKYLNRAIRAARKNQAETGAFGPEWFANSRELANPIDAIHYTGHVLDWLIPALPRERLGEPWVRKSVAFLADEMNLYMDQLMDYPEYAFHAAHALRTYHHRTNPTRRSFEKWRSRGPSKQPCPFLYCQEP